MIARNHYSVREIYTISVLAARTVLAARRAGISCDREFAERIMLAVTEVNGCELCSYAHARFALEAGVPAEEVRELLGGVTDAVPASQLPAVAFGQHYAHTRGQPDPEAWQQMVETYGEREALCVLRATRMMMWGNAAGIPLSSLRQRLRGRPSPGSTLRWELLTTVGAVVVTPWGVLRGAADHLTGQPPSEAPDPSSG